MTRMTYLSKEDSEILLNKIKNSPEYFQIQSERKLELYNKIKKGEEKLLAKFLVFIFLYSFIAIVGIILIGLEII